MYKCIIYIFMMYNVYTFVVSGMWGVALCVCLCCDFRRGQCEPTVTRVYGGGSAGLMISASHANRRIVAYYNAVLPTRICHYMYKVCRENYIRPNDSILDQTIEVSRTECHSVKDVDEETICYFFL